MREPVDTTIRGRRYRVVPLPTGKGLGILTLLTKTMARGLENVPSLADLARVSGSALADVLTNLREEDVERVAHAMRDATQCAPAPGDDTKLVPLASIYDTVFAANYREWLDWMRFALQVNYGFLGDLLRTVAPTTGAAAPPAASVATGTA